MISNIPNLESNAKTEKNVTDERDKRLADEKDKKLAEERAVTALKLQRKQRLEAMVQKRKTNFAYLKVKLRITKWFILSHYFL
jgi:hypothetical protein